MKKMIMLLVLVSFIALPSVVLAASTGAVQEGVLEMGDISDSTLGVEVSLSPSVQAVYVQPVAAASKATAQWFAVGAGHPGGTTVYGTAQNITNIYSMEISNATELTTALGKVPASEGSESDWSTNSWVK